MLWLEGRHDDKHVQQNVWSAPVGGGTAPEGTPRGPPWGDICFGGLPLQGVARSQRVPRVGRPGTTQAGSVPSLHRTYPTFTAIMTSVTVVVPDPSSTPWHMQCRPRRAPSST